MAKITFIREVGGRELFEACANKNSLQSTLCVASLGTRRIQRAVSARHRIASQSAPCRDCALDATRTQGALPDLCAGFSYLLGKTAWTYSGLSNLLKSPPVGCLKRPQQTETVRCTFLPVDSGRQFAVHRIASCSRKIAQSLYE